MYKPHTLFFMLLILFSSLLHPLHAKEHPNETISWMTDYQEAIALSKSTSRPIFLFFTGSDWCGWCHKLEKEILETSEFIQGASEKLIFVKLDYPMRSELDPTSTAQNNQLKEKYSVRNFPTIVLVDPDQQPIGVTGYRAGSGKQYAAHIMKMVNEYAAYKVQMRHLGAQNVSGKELKRLYQKAHELGLQDDANHIIRAGMESDLAPFFLTERYRYLVTHGQVRSKEAAILKQKLLESDSENKYLTHYQVAIIDFEANTEEMEKGSLSPEQVISPLVSYIAVFGGTDHENLWRLNMVISQFYLDKNSKDEALKYAKASYEAAPATIRPDIAMAIKNIERQLEPVEKN